MQINTMNMSQTLQARNISTQLTHLDQVGVGDLSDAQTLVLYFGVIIRRVYSSWALCTTTGDVIPIE